MNKIESYTVYSSIEALRIDHPGFELPTGVTDVFLLVMILEKNGSYRSLSLAISPNAKSKSPPTRTYNRKPMDSEVKKKKSGKR